MPRTRRCVHQWRALLQRHLLEWRLRVSLVHVRYESVHFERELLQSELHGRDMCAAQYFLQDAGQFLRVR